MRIVIVVDRFPQTSETFLASKVLGLIRRGLDVHVVCNTSGRSELAAIDPTGLLRDRIHALAKPDSRVATAGAAKARKYTMAAARSVRSGQRPTRSDVGHGRAWLRDAPIRALRPDVVHFEFGGLARERPELLADPAYTCTVSFRGTDLSFDGLDDPNYFTEVFRYVAAIHTLGPHLTSVARTRGLDNSRVVTEISPAIDTDRFTPPPAMREAGRIGTDARPLRLLAVGRLVPTKGHVDALGAVALLRDRGIVTDFRLVGDGPLRPAVALARRQLDIEEQVTFCGAQTPEQVRDHLSWADVFVHPSHAEGFANTVIEAQASGLCTIVSDAGGLVDNVGETGIIVPRRDVAALAGAIADVAADGALRTDLGRAGRARAVEHHSLEPHLDRWERFYVEAVRR